MTPQTTVFDDTTILIRRIEPPRRRPAWWPQTWADRVRAALVVLILTVTLPILAADVVMVLYAIRMGA